MTKTSDDHWQAAHYDDKIGFVSKLGRSLLPLLDPQPGERILDLGCGTGDLTAEIARSGAGVTGIDASPSMIAEARAKHAAPGIGFEAADARSYRAREPFHAVFSNAALHWIRPPEQAAETMWHALRPGGRVAVEFGGKGNVEAVVAAILETLRELGEPAESPWYFPSVGEYASLLEAQGFEVRSAELYDRPTKLADGEQGLWHWLEAFAFPFFGGWTPEAKRGAFEAIAVKTKPSLFRGGEWTADYRRLRVLAFKPG